MTDDTSRDDFSPSPFAYSLAATDMRAQGDGVLIRLRLNIADTSAQVVLQLAADHQLSFGLRMMRDNSQGAVLAEGRALLSADADDPYGLTAEIGVGLHEFRGRSTLLGMFNFVFEGRAWFEELGVPPVYLVIEARPSSDPVREDFFTYYRKRLQARDGRVEDVLAQVAPEATRWKLARILVDCSYIDFSRQPTGIPRVVSKYIEGALEWAQARDVEVEVVVPTAQGLVRARPRPPVLEMAARRKRLQPSRTEGGWLTRIFCDLAGPGATRHDVDPSQTGAQAGHPFPDLRISPGPADLLFSPAYWHDVDPNIYRELRASGMRVVTLVHDILPISFPACYIAPWRDTFKVNTAAVFSYADRIVTVSQYTADVLEEFRMRQRLPRVPITVAHNGFEPLVEAEPGHPFTYLNNPDLDAVLQAPRAPYLMVGSIEPKKAHVPVLRCFEGMWSGGYDRNLLIIGRRGWLEQPIIEAILTSPFYNERLFWLSDLDDADLARAYRGAHGLVFASLGEGFGIPMIESAHFGKPVLALETEIAREVLGSRAVYFTDGRSLIDAVLDMEDAEAHAAASAQAVSVSWPAWTDLMPPFYDELIRGLAFPT